MRLWEFVRNNDRLPVSGEVLEGVNVYGYKRLCIEVNETRNKGKRVDAEKICRVYLSEVMGVGEKSIDRIRVIWESSTAERDVDNVEVFFRKYQVEAIASFNLFIFS
jgi:hypothetical protein